MGFFDGLFNPTRNSNRAYGRAIGEQNRINAELTPFYRSSMARGEQASDALADLFGLNGTGNQSAAFDAYRTSPGFDAQMEAGTRAIDQSAAARGMLQSGATLKALQGYGQDLWDQGYQQHVGNIYGLTGQGAQGASGMQSGSSALQNLMIGQGASRDAGNQAFAGNVLGIAGTALGAFMNRPGFGRGGRIGGTGPIPLSNIRNPYAVF